MLHQAIGRISIKLYTVLLQSHCKTVRGRLQLFWTWYPVDCTYVYVSLYLHIICQGFFFLSSVLLHTWLVFKSISIEFCLICHQINFYLHNRRYVFMCEGNNVCMCAYLCLCCCIMFECECEVTKRWVTSRLQIHCPIIHLQLYLSSLLDTHTHTVTYAHTHKATHTISLSSLPVYDLSFV